MLTDLQHIVGVRSTSFVMDLFSAERCYTAGAGSGLFAQNSLLDSHYLISVQ